MKIDKEDSISTVEDIGIQNENDKNFLKKN